MKSRLLYTLGAMAVAGLTLCSCADDFLDQNNSHQLSQTTFFDSDEAVQKAVWPLYSYVWYDFNDKFYYGMGDGRANNITAQYSNYIYPYTNFTETPLSQGLTEAWGALYSVVAQSNNTINNISNYSSDNVSDEAKVEAVAEARFMRGTAYWYIASLWGCGIIYENTADLVNNYVVKANPRTDVMEYAIRDLEYAAAHLPASQKGAGRVTKYSAYGMLSRMYLSMAGITTEGQYNGSNIQTNFNSGQRNPYYLDLAKKAAEKVIKESGKSLLNNYADLFGASTIDNNDEALFQLQFMPGSGVGGAGQSMTRFLAWSTMVADQNAWGGATYCSYDLFEEFSNYDDKTLGEKVDDKVRRHNSVASYGESYPELSTDPSDPYVYGVTESAGNQGANVKKYVIGTKKVNGFSEPNNSGINTYMLRLAEVYLNYVDAAMGSDDQTTDPTALEYFNAVRKRAHMPVKNVVTYEDLRHEFRMEFAFEGLYWYQLIRRAYSHQQEVVNYLNNQNRNASYYEASTHSYKLSDSYTAPGPDVDLATAADLVLPMADADQTKNPNLKPDANGNIATVPYEFGEREVDEQNLFK
ncbi:RagB/SusD family nutrient uptake outer membrane protein [Prevotella lacticifex]|uniref:Glycan metabolism protein RagB n=1 Tax=Prevotella lacticifex TaxID=2854755 RepID=A0A9R1CY27_9BACT|nr:RagB/SusD family nutrient uptake outer membrane protein [Prevotella lacticifex]GJG36132.1 glycan metabolism protein RagB [Prevotella lacticifex]GJG38817.1 glycan metabolism protein RagB [Prevotella lacticifex]GJG42501.1 glycan metabolism protein RagB [Prevotella lacticifex]GJG45173.1 glycan metabolism protein RagB [Prevotella lacticifex]GJG48852.1 glycan metabolism protein RagB [Prevotella lacticifex]